MRLRRNLTTLSFVAPVLIGIVVFFLYPLLSAIYFSFTKFDLLTVPQWVGLDNYKRMGDDPFLWQSVRNTLWMVVVFVPESASRMAGHLCATPTRRRRRRSDQMMR